jgi:hypothetical protein
MSNDLVSQNIIPFKTSHSYNNQKCFVEIFLLTCQKTKTVFILNFLIIYFDGVFSWNDFFGDLWINNFPKPISYLN